MNPTETVLNNKFFQNEKNIKEFITAMNMELLCKIEELNTKLSILMKTLKVGESTKLVGAPPPAKKQPPAKSTTKPAKAAKPTTASKYTLFQRKFKEDDEFKTRVLASQNIQVVVNNNKTIAETKTEGKQNQLTGTFIWNLLKKDEYKDTLSMVENEIAVNKLATAEAEEQQIEPNSDDEVLTDKPARN